MSIKKYIQQKFTPLSPEICIINKQKYIQSIDIVYDMICQHISNGHDSFLINFTNIIDINKEIIDEIVEQMKYNGWKVDVEVGRWACEIVAYFSIKNQ